MKGSPASTPGIRLVQRRRNRAERTGHARVKVTVPVADADLIRALAACLRAGGDEAVGVRTALGPLIVSHPPRDGKELLAFFVASPLVGEQLRIERDRTPGREHGL